MSKVVNPTCSIKEASWYGFPAYVLQNSFFSTTVVPTLGGKIVSLFDVQSNREWLWKNPDLPPLNPQGSIPYIRNLGGWDECFPSVCESRFPSAPWDNVIVPDHGEIWSSPWKTNIIHTKDQIELVTTIDGIRLPYIFERNIRVFSDSRDLSFRYSVQNKSDYAMPFVWSAHPTLAASPGNKIVVPLEQVTVFGSLEGRFGPMGTRLTWPKAVDVEGKCWDFSVLPEATLSTAVKLFSAKSVANYAIFQDPVYGAELRFDFPSDEVTHIGIWLNFNGIGVEDSGPKYYCIALEPCIGGTDDLYLAYKNSNDCSVIPPTERRTWNLKVTFAPKDD